MTAKDTEDASTSKNLKHKQKSDKKLLEKSMKSDGLAGGGLLEARVNKTSKMQIISDPLEPHAPPIIVEIEKGLKMQ